MLVGEVRDRETAELALKASLTGHLVLTHAAHQLAVAALTRLVDMGVEPFLVASSLTRGRGAAAGPAALPVLRRGLRARRRDAGRARPRDPADLAGRAPRCSGAGCPDCGGTGYRGRTAVYEVLEVDAAHAPGAAHGRHRVLGRRPGPRRRA